MSYLINLSKELSAPHKHINYEVITHLDGEGFVHTDELDIPVSPGKIVIIPSGTLHNAVSEGDLERIYINGDFGQIFNFSSPVAVSDNKEKEGTTLAKMIYNNRYENADFISSLSTAFAHFLMKNLQFDDNIGLTVKEIISEITNNFYDCNMDLCCILNKSGYAEDYIRSHFKRITGKTPTAFLTDVRIKHACYLIDIYKNTLSLGQIAEKCGYTDYIYFSRKFKQQTGISPQSYKNQF